MTVRADNRTLDRLNLPNPGLAEVVLLKKLDGNG